MGFTEEELKKMNKPELIKLILNQQEIKEELCKLTNKVDELEKKMDELQSVNLVSQNSSTLLLGRVRKLESDLLIANQYSRRECLDISGLDDVEDEDIENEVAKIITDLGIQISESRDIQACHRYGSKKTVIVKFTNRKMVGRILSSKSSLPENIFINESLCPRNKTIRGRCNVLKKAGKISKIGTRNGMIRVKLPNAASYININHEDDLYDLFPDFEFEF